MIMKYGWIVAVFCLLSCSKYQQLLKSTDFDTKYAKGIEYYDKEDYYRALPLFEELLGLYRGTAKGAEVYYYYAYSHYGLTDYILAGYYFENYAKSFPKSKHTEECEFMNAYCNYLMSPISSLDQTNSQKAINKLQLFINKYPLSTRIEECNQLIDELWLKLETKSYDIALLYYKMEDYKGAISAFRNVLKDYPATKNKQKIMFYVFKSNYLLAINSIESKKEERLKNAIESYHNFVDMFPETEFMKEAESIYENVLTFYKKYQSKI